MQNIKKYFMTLALLLTAVTGAWAEEATITLSCGTKEKTFEKAELPWSSTAAILKEVISDLAMAPGIQSITGGDGKVVKNGNENFQVTGTFSGKATVEVSYVNTSFTTSMTTITVTAPAAEPTEWSLTPDETGKNWILAEMPASNVELQVEYFAESNLFLGKEALADKTSIAVKNGETAVEFDDEGKSTTTVTEGNTVTVKFTGKKVLGMKVAKKPESLIVNPVVGQIIGSDGKNYAYGSLPTGVTAVAKICYVSGSNGLALALTDEGTMNWSTAQTTCAAHTPAITGGTWKLATKDEWSNMITAAGSHTALRDGFSSVGGTNMKEDYPYWSSTEDGSDNVWIYSFSYGIWSKNNSPVGYVRACLAF